ncbi:MAG: hypothetical protein JXA71_18385 [Chitinispirillaceae bacterium]|nr:hypothetical protein [Chitinispirillaceae bacterium]
MAYPWKSAVRDMTPIPTAVLWLLLLPACSDISDELKIPYEPPVVFTGSISGDYDSLPGNRAWPNTCTLDNDTVHMTFFSRDFKEVNRIRSGNFIRIDLFPCSTCVSGISTKYIRFHLARYLESNWSYEITPADTVLNTNKISMQIRTLARSPGGAVELYDIGAIARPLTGTVELDLKNGRIFGSIR